MLDVIDPAGDLSEIPDVALPQLPKSTCRRGKKLIKKDFDGCALEAQHIKVLHGRTDIRLKNDLSEFLDTLDSLRTREAG